MKFSWESGSVIRWRGEDQYSDYMICIYSHAQDHMFVVYFRSNQIGRGEAWADAIALVKKHHNDQQKQKTITYQWQDYGAGRFALMKNIDEATTTCLGTVRFDFQAEQFGRVVERHRVEVGHDRQGPDLLRGEGHHRKTRQVYRELAFRERYR